MVKILFPNLANKIDLSRKVESKSSWAVFYLEIKRTKKATYKIYFTQGYDEMFNEIKLKFKSYVFQRYCNFLFSCLVAAVALV